MGAPLAATTCLHKQVGLTRRCRRSTCQRRSIAPEFKSRSSRARVRAFCVGKTVADCFKYRGRIGLDTAVEALQEVIARRRATPLEILLYAQVDRIESVIRPYLAALT